MQRKKIFTLVLAGLLTAISVVLKFWTIPITFMGGLAKELNFSPVIIMYAGILLGPFYGGVIGGITDVLGHFLKPFGAYLPWFTITNVLMGLLPGLLCKKKKPETFWQTLLPVGVTWTLCSAVFNNIILVALGFLPVKIALLRAVGTLLLIPVYNVLVFGLHGLTAPRYNAFLTSHSR